MVKIWNIDDTAKQELLNKLTREQADFLAEKVYPVITAGKIFELVAKSDDYAVYMSISPGAQKYFEQYVNIVDALPNSVSLSKEIDDQVTDKK